MSTPQLRQALSALGLLHKERQCFVQIPDKPSCEIALVDHLMSALALFVLKYPFLLKLDEDRRDGTTSFFDVPLSYRVLMCFMPPRAEIIQNAS
jgi:hypothetical protein